MKKPKSANAFDFLNKKVEVVVDRPLGSKHPKHGFLYEVNYGYVPNTKSPDGEELDAYVLCVDKPLKSFKGKCVAVVRRRNDNDDKLVIVPKTKEPTDEKIQQSVHFQEKFFEYQILRRPGVWYPHKPYNAKYSKLFEKEKKALENVLNDIKIHHFGSSSVPGLGGKGYIDIYAVCNKKDILKVSKKIQSETQYVYKEHASIPGERLFFKKSDKHSQIYHLHLTYRGHPDIKRTLGFKQHLIDNPKYAKQYEKIKKRASVRANKQRTKKEAQKVYMDIKRKMIEGV